MDKRKKIACILMLLVVVFNTGLFYFCIRVFARYKEIVDENPIFPKPDYLFGYIHIAILLLFFVNIASGIAIYKLTHKKRYSDYEKYLLKELYGNSYNPETGKNERENTEQKTDGKLNEETTDSEIDKDKGVIALMLNSNKEITEYFEISKKQEKISYGISVGCAIVGVAMLIVSIFAVFLNFGIEATVITIVSGAITEVVSGIVLWIHNKSAMQLNYYYDALHENEKFLSAINLADKLEKKEKEQMYMEIIKAQISATDEKEDGEK